MKRASGRVRHAVRVELLLAVAARGPQCWPSRRAAALELADLVDAAASTIRRALADDTLADEVDLAIEARAPFGVDPVIHEGSQEGSQGGSQEGASGPDPAEPLVRDPAPDEHAVGSPLISTSTSALSGPAVVPPASAGRRPKQFRRSRFAGRCVLCLDELVEGRAFYLVPYDVGTSVYCHNDAPLGLAMAQMLHDVERGRPVPEELELIVRPRRPRP